MCPVCLGLPGALPVLNRAAVDDAIRAALALGCTIHETSIFARKNYFYPDLPKGYQISQYELPIATAGVLEYRAPMARRCVSASRACTWRRTRANPFTTDSPIPIASHTSTSTAAACPLIEIVTEPDLRSAAAAAEFFSRLRAILVWLGVNDGNMEEGSLRCDANVSVRPAGTERLGTKAEVKNLNSFRFLQKALEYEIGRQIDVVSAGGRVVQETRLFDPAAGHTVSMRSKEEAHDYRYFPDPDLPPVSAPAERVQRIRAAMPELPDARRRRFVDAYGLPDYDAVQLTQSRALADYFETAVAAGAPAKLASNWIMGELARKLKELGADAASSSVPAGQLAELVVLVARGTISGSIAKNVLERMFATGRSAGEIVAAEGLTQIDDESEIVSLIAEVLAKNADAVEQFRGGKATTFGFLVGQVMKAAKGKASPARVNELLKKALGSS